MPLARQTNRLDADRDHGDFDELLCENLVTMSGFDMHSANVFGVWVYKHNKN